MSVYEFTNRATIYTPIMPDSCWKDDESHGHSPEDEAKKVRIYDHRSMPDRQSLMECAVSCGDAGFNRMGYQYGRQCWCGTNRDDHERYGKSSVCKDGKGGHYSSSIYNIAPGSVNGNPSADSGSARGYGSDLGCFKDSADNSRVFATQLITRGLDLSACAEQCGSSGYNFMGYENQNECWCGLWQTLQSIYNRYGAATTCANGKGGEWAFNAYRIR